MNSPQQDIRRVVRELCEPSNANEMLQAVDQYFSPDSQIIYPLFNSPKASGIEGVKAAYKMLRVLTYGNSVDFHAIGFDRIYVEKGVEKQRGIIDFTEHLKFKFPLPEKLNPWFHVRFLTRLDLVRNPNDEKWYVEKQEDNLPTDFGSSGIRVFPFDAKISNFIKWCTGTGTLLVGGTLSRLNIL
ncbi:hypothetical protein JCM11641_002582 [Rhodosporidiobolus odoratus]